MEIELKLEIDPDCADPASLLSLLAGEPAASETLVSHYFDTPGLDLLSAGFAVRIRHIGRRRVQTIKAEGTAAAGLFVRPEWEQPVKGNRPRFEAGASPLPELFAPALLDAVTLQFSTRFTRARWNLERDGARIELALDEGRIVRDDHAEPLREIEIELKSGPTATLFALAHMIAEQMPVRIGVQSKSERGFALVRAPALAPRRQPVSLDPAARPADAFVTIAQSCIRHYRLNEALVLRAGDRAGVHQARVALRQLRTAFRLFAPILGDDAEGKRLRTALGALAADYGAVRNLDVLLVRFRGKPRRTLDAARADALAVLLDRLAASETRTLFLDLSAWLALGTWRQTQPEEARTDTRDFAAHALERARKRLKRRGKSLSRLPAKERHRARIEAKRLRYAAEFFQSLYRGRKARRRMETFRTALASLQDLLGELNDREMAPQVLARYGISSPLPGPPGTPGQELLAGAGEALDLLIDTKPFWRG